MPRFAILMLLCIAHHYVHVACQSERSSSDNPNQGCWSGCRNCMQLSEEVSTCLSCEGDMVLADTVVNDVSVKQCLPCDPGCASCDAIPGMTTTTCTRCHPGYTVDHWMLSDTGFAMCIACQPNCGRCEIEANSVPVCEKCYRGFMLLTQGRDTECIACEPGCGSCYEDDSNPGSSVCSSCNQGYTMAFDGYRNMCMPCPPNCASCWNTGPAMGTSDTAPLTQCTQCQPGYGIVIRGWLPSCEVCPQGCRDCFDEFEDPSASAGDLTCLMCERGLVMDESGSCVNRDW